MKDVGLCIVIALASEQEKKCFRKQCFLVREKEKKKKDDFFFCVCKSEFLSSLTKIFSVHSNSHYFEIEYTDYLKTTAQ